MIVPALNNLQDMFQGLLDQQALGGMVEADACHAAPSGFARGRIARAAGRCRRVGNGSCEIGRSGCGCRVRRRKWGPRPTSSVRQPRAKGEYFSFRKRTQGQATAAVLSRELPQLILKIQWPKTMYWNGKGTERFIRPIRWLVALLGDAGCSVRNRRRAVRQHHGRPSRPGKIGRSPSPSHDFSQAAKANGVILSAEERRERIEAGLRRCAVKPDPRPTCTRWSTSPNSLRPFSAASIAVISTCRKKCWSP